MSTSAIIVVDETTFYQSHDGSPIVVVSELQEMIKEAQRRTKDKPSHVFFRNLKDVMRNDEREYKESDFADGQYEYSIDEKGKIFVRNIFSCMVEISVSNDRITIFDGAFECTYDDWSDYEDFCEGSKNKRY